MRNIINQDDLTPLTIHEFKLFAPARVNQVNTLAFLDTGASFDTISQKLAEGLPRTGLVPVTGAFDQRLFDIVSDIEIDFLGNLHRADAHVDQIPASRLPFNTGVTLGAPTIFAKAVLLDFRLTGIMFPQQVSGASWIALPVKFVERKDVCLIQLASQNGTVQALFDTGAGISVINSIHSAEIGLDLQPDFELEINDVTGAKTTLPLALCSGLSIGDAVLPSFDCFSTDLQAVEKALGCRVDMVFGANAMLKSGFRWLFDKPEGKAFVTT